VSPSLGNWEGPKVLLGSAPNKSWSHLPSTQDWQMRASSPGIRTRGDKADGTRPSALFSKSGDPAHPE
jgi:hypothetical protein